MKLRDLMAWGDAEDIEFVEPITAINWHDGLTSSVLVCGDEGGGIHPVFWSVCR